jgi:hypothetical protein
MTRIAYIFLLAGIFSATSTWSADKGSNGLSAIQQEAFDVGKQYLEGRILKCEDNFFYKYSWGISASKPNIFQVLEPQVFLLDVGAISSIDQLNGLEWSGGMKLKFKAIRVLEEQSSGTWTWGQWVERPSGINIAYAKNGGQWAMKPSMDGVFGDPPAACDDIPVKPPPVNKKEAAPAKPATAKPFKI